jgi:hypothetical protein
MSKKIPYNKPNPSMNKLLTLLSLAALAVAIPGSALAQAKKAAEKAADAAKETANKAKGDRPLPMNIRADAIDTRAKTITTKRKDNVEIKHVLTDKTEIMNAGAAAKLSDIKIGDYVGGLRHKKSETEYEVVKITKFGPQAPRKPKAEGDAKPAEKKTN